MFEADLVTNILAYAPVSSLVGTRMQQAPISQDIVFPAIGFTRVSTEQYYSQDGECGLANARVQYDCWAETDVDAWTLADALRNAFKTFNLTAPDTAHFKPRPNFVINEFMSPVPDKDPVIFRVIVEAKHYFLN